MNPSDANSIAGNSSDLELCPCCLFANSQGTDFCNHCGAPISATATMDPMKQIYAQGWMYRTVAQGGNHAIVLVGFWLLLGTGIVQILLVLFDRSRDGPAHQPAALSILSYVVLLAALVLQVALLHVVTRGYIRGRLPRQFAESPE